MIDRHNEVVPDITLRLQKMPASGGQTKVAPAPFSRSLDPSAGNQSSIFEPAENGIERGNTEDDLTMRELLDRLSDLISMTLPVLQQTENQQLGTSLLQLIREHIAPQYTFTQYIVNLLVLNTSAACRLDSRVFLPFGQKKKERSPEAPPVLGNGECY